MGEEERLYTERELHDLVARRLTEEKLRAMEGRFTDMETRITEAFSAFRSDVKSFQKTIEDHNVKVDRCREEIDHEIHSTFATKLELEGLRGDLRVLASRFAFALTTVTALIQLGARYLLPG